MNPQQIERLKTLNAEPRYRHHGPTFVENEYGKLRQTDNGGVTCDIIDRTMRGNPYASATAADPSLALDAALDAAERAPKPMTPAQKAHAEKHSKGVANELAAARAEIARLKAQIAGEPEPPADDPPEESPPAPADSDPTPPPPPPSKGRRRMAL